MELMIAKHDHPIVLHTAMGNRHGLIAGATGTGKTVTLKVVAEAFSKAGVPVFLSDIKGDLGSAAEPGVMNDKIQERLDSMQLTDFKFRSFPTTFWDIYGQHGLPIRASLSEMGPLLLSRLLDLNETQSSILHIVFQIADEQGLLLIDLKDLKEMLHHVSSELKTYTVSHGHMTKQSIGAIQRSITSLEAQGADRFFGEPSLNLNDLMTHDDQGFGTINVLTATELIGQPKTYTTFLLWLLSELFEELPEVGDLDKPKLVFFFDEAHLLFDDAPKALLEQVEKVVRLIRSKGIGIYFITQNPIDLPETVLGQLGNRIQHALRAYTPRDQKAVKAAAETFRINPNLNIETAITELKTGEALISMLDEEGRPSIVKRALILPPESKMGVIDSALRQKLIQTSPLATHYNKVVDRESAYEVLKERIEKTAQTPPVEVSKPKPAAKSTPRKKASAFEKAATSLLNTVGRQLGRELVRGLLGGLKKR